MTPDNRADLLALAERGNPAVRDCRPDQTGLDDGPYLPGRAPRRKPAPKSPAELSAIRVKAWETRRALATQEGQTT